MVIRSESGTQLQAASSGTPEPEAATAGANETAFSRLLQLQNPDGGWGSWPGRPSTTEATALAVMALDGAGRDPGKGSADPGRAPEEAGLGWLRSRQRPDGAWPASDQVPAGSWMTPLAVLALSQRADDRARAVRGATWLLSVKGRGYMWATRLILWLFPEKNVVRLDPDLQGWPWAAGAFGWVEPTAYSLLALKSLRPDLPTERTRARIREGELMIRDRMCLDGGWNYGNSVVLDEELWPYPDTTALALLSLQGAPVERGTDLSLAALRRMLDANESALSTSLGILCLEAYGEDPSAFRQRLERTSDRWVPLGETRSIALAVMALDGRNPFRVETT